MDLKIKRILLTPLSTIGELSIEDKFFCYTLEDAARKTKIYGETCIPTGTYKVALDYSPRFKRTMPHILDVPGFEGVRIHVGNWARDTEGCILVGYLRGKDMIGSSKKAFNDLIDKLTYASTNNVGISIQIS